MSVITILTYSKEVTTQNLNPEAREALLKRLRRIEGQVRGLHKMAEEGRTCDEILIQMDATRKAMASASLTLLQEFLGVFAGQLAQDKAGGIKVEEVTDMLRRFTQ
ncbi:hypothetical protein MGR01S_25110 [Meiothermus granaticius NBRC 107808]|uniref:Copper-sensing transcriptional repressor CsoR n=1 Tax=Meiothermus granaticius NBRC 107808 TaxID=1227551 RepID=A0A399FA46_9DEIN|nr:Copper-sensing transcriptional repressor CsoR [Meiothermus granaticius NBRC 107808]GEM87886.1 hypothetical protein MGR01S_25110 [Meiothermus granaticius NBRC 107808]